MTKPATLSSLWRINPLDLQVHQLHVVTDSLGTEWLERDWWLRTALLNSRKTHQIRWRVEQDKIVFELPHSEFILTGPSMPEAQMHVRPLPSFATVAEFQRRLLLVNGYHRTFFWLNRQRNGVGSNIPELSLLFPVSTALPFLNPPDQQTTDVLLAPRPPFFRDFFDERLALLVCLRRKKHYEMRIQVTMTGVNSDAEAEDKQGAGED